MSTKIGACEMASNQQETSVNGKYHADYDMNHLVSHTSLRKEQDYITMS